ncbi:MAG: DUF4382 domain-containing protein [Gammaproteobacteria bacterium]|nr:DUF4382 domain-containing protein [Gammaproteobacteria bacterium]
MKLTWGSRLGAVIATAGAAVGCSSGGGSVAPPANEGTLSIGLTDAPVTDVSEIWLEITGLNIKPAGNGPALEFPFDEPRTVDLLQLTPDNAEWLLDGETVPAGEYNWLELELNAEFDSINDSYVVTTAGGEEELRVPSDSLRLVSGFTVTADQETAFLIDWDARLGLVGPPGQPGYMLRPAFRIVDMTEYGTLSGVVDTALVVDPACAVDDQNGDLDTGNVVYIYEGPGAVAEDIDEDGAEPGPVATAAVEQGTNGDYAYSTILSPGDYSVAFTCLAGHDDPLVDDPTDPAEEGAVVFTDTADVTINNEEEATVDF